MVRSQIDEVKTVFHHGGRIVASIAATIYSDSEKEITTRLTEIVNCLVNPGGTTFIAIEDSKPASPASPFPETPLMEVLRRCTRKYTRNTVLATVRPLIPAERTFDLDFDSFDQIWRLILHEREVKTFMLFSCDTRPANASIDDLVQACLDLNLSLTRKIEEDREGKEGEDSEQAGSSSWRDRPSLL